MGIGDWGLGIGDWALCHDGMDDENTLDQPEKIIPQPGTGQVEAGKQAAAINDNLPAKSFRIYKIKK